MVTIAAKLTRQQQRYLEGLIAERQRIDDKLQGAFGALTGDDPSLTVNVTEGIVEREIEREE